MSFLSSESRGSVNGFPNELLYEIFNHLDRERPRRFPLWKRKLETYDALLKVSRRWRSVALPFIWRCIAHATMKDYWDNWHLDIPDDRKVEPSDLTLYYGDRKTATMVRHLRIGSVAGSLLENNGMRQDRNVKLLEDQEQLPFPNLLTLEKVAGINTSKFLQTLPAACPRLEDLTITWEFSKPFPDAEALSKVQILRIFIAGGPWNIPGPFSPQTFHNLTTLHVRNNIYANDERDHISMCCQMSFPKLRVLRLESIGRGTLNIYDFIQRHPTIHQVALHFNITSDSSLRLEPLVKLITGTGVWRKSTSGSLVDQPSYREFNVHTPVPPNFDMTYGGLLRFAFSRVPLAESVEPHEPRYRCTGFAVDFRQDIQLPAFAVTDYDSRDGIDFIHDIKSEGKALSCFEDLEELNLASTHFSGGALGFAETMDLLASGLRKLKKLRSLRISFPALVESSWRSGSLNLVADHGGQYVQADRELSVVAFLDEVCPHAFTLEHNGDFLITGVPTTLRKLRLLNYRMDQIGSAVREALSLEPEESLDEDDGSLLLRAWEAHNQVKMEKIVRRLVKARPTLERFEWWVINDNQRHGIIHWERKIGRPSKTSDSKPSNTVGLQSQDAQKMDDEDMDDAESDASFCDGRDENQGMPDLSVRLKGNLTWTGCLKGSPPEFPVLVGDELEYQYKHAWGRSRPL